MTEVINGHDHEPSQTSRSRAIPRVLSDPELNAYIPTLWTRVRGVAALTVASDLAACLLAWLCTRESPRPALLLTALLVGLSLVLLMP